MRGWIRRILVGYSRGAAGQIDDSKEEAFSNDGHESAV
jgi:hypothetical protein